MKVPVICRNSTIAARLCRALCLPLRFVPLALLILTCALPCSAKGDIRIVSLAPAMTEVLFAIGAGKNVVARTTVCDYPPDALAVPAIGGFDGKSISAERIIACRPALVCGAAGMHDWLSPILKPLGITLFLSRARTVHEVMEEITELGTITECNEGARSTVRAMEETLRSAPPLSHGAPVTAYWEVWSSPLMAAGASSFLSDILTLAGAQNIFFDTPAPYPSISDESVLRRNPAVIILSADVYPNKAGALNALRGRPGWSGIDAVKNERVILLDSTAVRAGPRVADAVLLLAREIKGDTHD